MAGLATFGIFGAIGTRVVDSVWTEVSQKESGPAALISVRDALDRTSFHLATPSGAGSGLDLEAVKDCPTLFRAAQRAGGARVRDTMHNVVLEGGTDRDLTIVNLRAKILKRTAPLGGTSASCANAGAVDAIGVIFDLDEPRPVARRIVSMHDPGARYFRRGNVVALKHGEVQPFQIEAITYDHYVEWEITADVLIDGKRDTITIDDDGKPFRITGPVKKYRRYREWLWFEEPERLYTSSEKPFTTFHYWP